MNQNCKVVEWKSQNKELKDALQSCEELFDIRSGCVCVCDCRGVDLCFGPGRLGSVKADSAGRQPVHCLITYCLLSIIVSLWEMAIDPCVFVCAPVIFLGLTRTYAPFRGYKQRELVHNTKASTKKQYEL